MGKMRGILRLRIPDPGLGVDAALICLCIYFSGVATGAYALMFVWVVQLTAYFFPGRRALAHLAWILVAYAVTLAVVPTGTGYSVVTLWFLTAFTLAIIFWLARGLRREFAARRRLADASATRPITTRSPGCRTAAASRTTSCG